MWGRRGVPRLYAMTLPLSTYNMLDFNNTEIAFSSKSRGELQNAYWLFNTIKYPWLVKCAKVATSIALKIHFPLAWAVKPTLYKQFVGGETLQDCSAAINHLMKYNVKSTLDYSAESEQTPEGIQATFEETLRLSEDRRRDRWQELYLRSSFRSGVGCGYRYRTRRVRVSGAEVLGGFPGLYPGFSLERVERLRGRYAERDQDG